MRLQEALRRQGNALVNLQAAFENQETALASLEAAHRAQTTASRHFRAAVDELSEVVAGMAVPDFVPPDSPP